MKNIRSLFFLILTMMLMMTLYVINSKHILRPAAENKQYALLLSDTMLYRAAEEDYLAIDNSYFLLPQTYFVEVISEGELLTKCRYQNFEGFVLSEDIEIVDYLPKYIFPKQVTLSLASEVGGLKLRARPDTGAEVLTTVSDSEAEIVYFNHIDGGSVAALGSKWYYVAVESGEEIKYGYLFAAYLSISSTIPENIIEAVVPEVIIPPIDENPLPPMEKEVEWIFIALLCLPVGFVIFVLFRGNQRAPKGKKYYDQNNG